MAIARSTGLSLIRAGDGIIPLIGEAFRLFWPEVVVITLLDDELAREQVLAGQKHTWHELLSVGAF